MPPTATSSDIEDAPLGRRAAKTGTSLPMRVKSSIFSLTPAEEAIANRCSTALVEPPSAITTVIAFSKDLPERIWRGVMLRLIRLTTAAPARWQSSRFWLEMASCAELFGKLIPIASIADALVLGG